MHPDVITALAGLPALDRARRGASARPCKICGASAPFCDVVDFNKCAGGYLFGPARVPVEWHRCGICGTLFTPFFDDWTQEDFRRFVYNDDYIKVDPDYAGPRPRRMLDFLRGFLGAPDGIRILDYGSGAGLLVDGLRAAGYDATGYDPFSAPSRPDGMFDFLTCFEVLEHSPEPMNLLRDMRGFLAPGGAILLGQGLQPADIETLRANWWYCAPRNGHCSTFTLDGLLFAAEALGLALHSRDTRHAFVHGEGRLTARLATLLGPPVVSLTLTAPGERVADGWHGLERPPHGPQRWTARPEVVWRAVPGATGLLRIRIPVRMAIRPGFLQECRIAVNGAPLRTQATASCLMAETERAFPAGEEVMIVLRTPPPQSPAKLRGAPDTRDLGIAVVA